MGKYFGTDGIRGIANTELNAELAFRVGRAAAYTLTLECSEKPRLLIGKDTRLSSDMLEAALVAGICSVGADVELLGVIPTPAVAYLTLRHRADAGIVISASHNPFEYNGIKIFGGNGYKLTDEMEARIESLIDDASAIPAVQGAALGHRIWSDISALEEYTDYLAETVEGDLSGLRVAVDCANGASSTTVFSLFRKLNCQAEIRFYEPDGVNINDGCGSTHLENLQLRMRSGQFDVGVAFDGDADRCLVVDDRGETLDGDRIMAVCAAHMKKQGKLRGNAFVATVMSNMGLHAYAREQGMEIQCSDVGDRNVLEMMLRDGYILGGEQSGHVIFLEYATTGDGQLTAVQFLKILKDSGLRASQIAAMVRPYPQVMVNVAVPNDMKKQVAQRPEVKACIDRAQSQLGEGRVLVRPSGTEALVRVMAEGKCEQTVRNVCDTVAKTIESIV